MSHQRGSGTLSAAIGLTVALLMLLTTVQLVARLHRTAAMAAVAVDAAHTVAEARSAGDRERARLRAEQRIRTLFGPEAVVLWADTPDGPSVQLRVPGPALPGLTATLDRGAVARIEAP